jgi:hypothetical protein
LGLLVTSWALLDLSLFFSTKGPELKTVLGSVFRKKGFILRYNQDLNSLQCNSHIS